MNGTDIARLQERLELAQRDIRAALENGHSDRIPALVQTREADLASLASNLGHEAATRAWALDYLVRDREVTAQLLVARDVTAAKLADMRRARGVHRAYLSSGLSG